jgi:hypothetical protein
MEHKLETTIDANGVLTLHDLPFRAGETVEVVIQSRPPQKAVTNGTPSTIAPRILGLHAGAFTVSEDFDAPLPEEFWLGAE